jgi:alkyldihydroxyacetonephosphate synthase
MSHESSGYPMTRRRKFWGWGYEDAGPDEDQAAQIARAVADRLGAGELRLASAPRIEDVTLPVSRIAAPRSLRTLCSAAPFDRASHTYGKSYRDIVRGVRCEFAHPPDLVATPRDESDVVALLDWCSETRVAAIPYGGGSSVVAGVEAVVGEGFNGAVSIDLTQLNRVIEIDRVSRAARIQGGILGPALEDALRPEGLTLRHFPQSFEFSTLGGWIATRSGGHYATLYTHIDDFVESLRVVTPTGIVESRRLPGSGAGPSSDRLFIGSEGALGIVVEAWMRLQDRPSFRASTSVLFRDTNGDAAFRRGAEAVRALSQTGLFPTNCRLLDPLEAVTSGAGDGTAAVLVLGFESADHPLDPWMERARECCRDAGGDVPEDARRTLHKTDAPRSAAADAWRNAFLGAPYIRDILVRAAVISETFESAVTWDRFEAFYAGVMQATRDAVKRVCGPGTVACRFTHAYPDGVAPYFTVMAAGRRGSELEQWAEIKAAASEAILRYGGTITHHHAVGRDHLPWYETQRSEGFARALRAVKAEFDPGGVLNPGVLIGESRVSDPQTLESVSRNSGAGLHSSGGSQRSDGRTDDR